MSEWWSYRFSDLLMFSPETYYRLFELYNTVIWPVQIAALASGAVIFALMLSRLPWSGRAVSLLLALAWLFVAFIFIRATRPSTSPRPIMRSPSWRKPCCCS